jgi:hypothetical protein
MIPWDQIDQCLEALGKDRVWLSCCTHYTASYLRNVLAPNARHRPERALALISECIEKERDRQKALVSRPPGMHELWMAPEELNRADLASRLLSYPSLADFCRDAIQRRAREIIANQSDSDNIEI